MALSTKEDGQLQLAAGLALLSGSRLVNWDPAQMCFVVGDEEAFELAASEEDELFGRLIKWMQFSAGAEFLLKGVLLLNKVGITKSKRVLVIPASHEILQWIPRVLSDSAARISVNNYGALQTLTPSLKALCDAQPMTEEADRDVVRAAFEILRDSIRNRDAHAYVPNVRQDHYPLIQLFCPAFNTLLSWVPDKALLAKWRQEAKSIIAATT